MRLKDFPLNIEDIDWGKYNVDIVIDATENF